MNTKLSVGTVFIFVVFSICVICLCFSHWAAGLSWKKVILHICNIRIKCDDSWWLIGYVPIKNEVDERGKSEPNQLVDMDRTTKTMS